MKTLSKFFSILILLFSFSPPSLKLRRASFLIFVFLFLTFSVANAQVPTGGTNPGCRPQVWMCPEIKQLDNFKINIKASGLPEGSDVYVVCGVTTESGWVFTTGNDQNDQALCMGAKNYSRLSSGSPKPPIPYTLSVAGGNPIRPVGGNIDVTVRAISTGNATSHTCMLAYITDPVETAEPARRANSLQYESLSIFARPTACLTVHQDPFGRVFNATTLKPLPNISATILDNLKKNLNIVGVVNPVTTLADGLFNFVVPAGSYFLKTPLAIASSVHKNASLAYDNILSTYDSPVIENEGETKQVDIAVDTADARFAPVLKLMEQGTMQLGRQMRFSGKASWPLTKVSVRQTAGSLASGQADKFGYFEYNIDNTKINAEEGLTIVLEEVDLTVDSKNVKPTGKTAEVVVDPVPTYLEGFAKDSAGNLIPLAAVKVKLTSTDTIYFETTADDKAFFSISPRNLPIIPFYLEFTPPNSLTKIKATIPEFAISNKEYLAEKQVNLMAGTIAGEAVDPVLAADFAVPTQALRQNPNSEGAVKSTVPSSAKLALAIIIIILIIIFSGLAFFVIKKKQEE